MELEEIKENINRGIGSIENHIDIFTEQEKEDYHYMISNIEVLINIVKRGRTETEKHICSICGKEYEGYGNNAQPVNSGRCCNECNIKIVIPRRIQDYKQIKGED